MYLTTDIPQAAIDSLRQRVRLLVTTHHRVRGGRVHLIDPLHRYSMALGPTYYCGIAHADDDEPTASDVTCGACLRALLGRDACGD